MNTVTIHGNVTAAPSLRFTASGRAVAGFTVAANSRRYDRTQQRWVDRPPVFHRVAAFGDLAQNLAESIVKGSTVTVTGEFVDASYIPEDGEQLRRAIQLNATDVAVSLRFATAVITRNPRASTAPPAGTGGHAPAAQPTDAGEHHLAGPDADPNTGDAPPAAPAERTDTGEPAGEQPPARPVRGINKAPSGPKRVLRSVG